MAKISPEFKSALADAGNKLELAIDYWREMDIDDFHGLRIVQEEFEKIRKTLEARK